MSQCTHTLHHPFGPDHPIRTLSASQPVRLMMVEGGDPSDWSNWFTCCEMNHLDQIRADADGSGYPALVFLRWMRTPRWVRAIPGVRWLMLERHLWRPGLDAEVAA